MFNFVLVRSTRQKRVTYAEKNSESGEESVDEDAEEDKLNEINGMYCTYTFLFIFCVMYQIQKFVTETIGFLTNLVNVILCLFSRDTIIDAFQIKNKSPQFRNVFINLVLVFFVLIYNIINFSIWNKKSGKEKSVTILILGTLIYVIVLLH